MAVKLMTMIPWDSVLAQRNFNIRLHIEAMINEPIQYWGRNQEKPAQPALQVLSVANGGQIWIITVYIKSLDAC